MNVWIVVKSAFINPDIEDIGVKYECGNLKNSEVIGVFMDEDDARKLQEEVLPCYDADGNEMDVYIEEREVK